MGAEAIVRAPEYTVRSTTTEDLAELNAPTLEAVDRIAEARRAAVATATARPTQPSAYAYAIRTDPPEASK